MLTVVVTLLMPAHRPALYAQTAPAAPVRVTQRLLATPTQCEDRFVAHPLEHLTTTADGVVRGFQANGAGLAVGDLDNDGDLDLVLGSQQGANSIFWNEGGLRLRKSQLGEGPTRAVTIVDVDGDGQRDIVLTTDRGALIQWRNDGRGEFVRTVLPGVARPAYVINWSDLEGDGDLDLVTASYDAGFLAARGNEYLTGGGSGVYVYTQEAGRFRPVRLAGEAQALALAVTDIAGDDRPDILVGNDFGLPDALYVQSEDGWTHAESFANTTHSTMSFDLGDIDNNGQAELFASDMKPYADPSLEEAYRPLMEAMMEAPHPADDPQRMENMLQMRTATGYANQAAGWQVDGTGWSWSARFGDLDNDGLLDLYVVNGMIEERMFAHLPAHELVERNQAFRNQGDVFVPMPGWDLDATASGRSMSMADLDEDGDLDIVVNNVRSPAVLYENRLCRGQAVEVELSQSGRRNRDALGAAIELRTERGLLYRDVRAAGGYLSGDTARVQFGLPPGAAPRYLRIRWPDGAVSVVDKVLPNRLVQVERLD